jgi:predicted RNase H-like nuclease (RuvC/YqgF family)
MTASAGNILRYWQSERANEPSSGPSTSRQSYRFNSPQGKKEAVQAEASKVHRLSEENTDIKKTIKLSKNYIRELNDKTQENEKQHELKKHRSMEFLLKQEEHSEEQRTGSHFRSKIDELNKKLTNIREALINKKSTDHPRESLENFISR